MAKANDQPQKADQPQPSVHDVALRLFEMTWRPNGLDAWMIATQCYRAAIAFARVSGRIAEGLSPDDVIAEQQLLDEQRALAAERADAEPVAAVTT